MRTLTGPGTGSYTAKQLAAALAAGSGAIGPRFEVYDVQNNRLAGELTTVSSATVDFDATRAIPGSLSMTFDAEDPLLPYSTTPFTKLVKPFARFRMPDGGLVEWAKGVYLYGKPARDVHSVDPYGLEAPVAGYTVTCGDQNHLLELGGPDLNGWVVPTAQVVTGAILAAVQAGVPYDLDSSGIVPSDRVTTGTLAWSMFAEGNPEITRHPDLPDVAGGPTTSWSTIARVLHSGLGYMPPWWDDDGLYVARPMPLNLFSTDPVTTWTTNRKSITELPFRETPHLEGIANRVFVHANHANANSYAGSAVADANVWLPGHSLSEAECGLFVNVALSDVVANGYHELLAAAITNLFLRMALVSDLELTTQFIPNLEPWDLIGLIVPGDPVYGTLGRIAARAWSTDLFTGKMIHRPMTVVGGTV